MSYRDFITHKRTSIEPCGFSVDSVNPNLFDWQADIVRWALRVGRCDLFEQPGLGKTIQQLSWADEVVRRGNVKRLLLLCPLAVAKQTLRESEKFGIQTSVKVCREQSEVDSGITITNYERLHKFDCKQFDAVVADESSCIKSFSSKTRDQLITEFAHTRYRLPCTATPAPNDYMELGNHAEFTGVMSRTEMLSMFFIHDGGETSKWRLRGHAEQAFWQWMAQWSLMIRKPSDLGYPNLGYDLPPLNMHDIVVENSAATAGNLFALEAQTLAERRVARKQSVASRAEAAAELANASNEPWLIWCDLNDESSRITKAIPDAVEVKGSDSPEHKEAALDGFADGSIRVLVTKPSIAAWGLNYQHCCKMAFVGLSDSFEQFFQAVRRCWRFGQIRPVDVYVITSHLEGAVVDNIRRKELDAERMLDAMVANMADITAKNIRSSGRMSVPYNPQKGMVVPSWLQQA